MGPLVTAFRNSMRGFGAALRSERAVRQEFAVLAVSVPAALLIASGLWVRVALVGTILLTLAVEMLNTAVEKLCDHVTPQHHAEIALVKDMGSAAVFCALVLSALVWGAALLQALGF